MSEIYNGSLPLYYQVETHLRHRILSGEIKAGEKLPPEKELCKENGVSQGTLRKALSNLEAEKLIDRKAGKGTFVRPGVQDLILPVHMRLSGSLDELIFHGKTSQVAKLEIGTRPVNSEEAAFFGVAEGVSLPHFKRLKTVEGFPVYYFENLVAQEIGSKIQERELLAFPPLVIFEKKFGIKITRINQVIGITKLNATMAKLLETNTFEPGLHHRSYVYGNRMKPIEIIDMYCRADRFKLIANFTRKKGKSATRPFQEIEKYPHP
jgi:GntR family transcriptional regulator